MTKAFLFRTVGNYVPDCIASKRITLMYCIGLFREEVWQRSVF